MRHQNGKEYKKEYIYIYRASQVSLVVKNLLANAGDRRGQVTSLGWEDSLEKDIATHSSILAWRIPCTEEPGRTQSMGLTGSDMTETI